MRGVCAHQTHNAVKTSSKLSHGNTGVPLRSTNEKTPQHIPTPSDKRTTITQNHVNHSSGTTKEPSSHLQLLTSQKRTLNRNNLLTYFKTETSEIILKLKPCCNSRNPAGDRLKSYRGPIWIQRGFYCDHLGLLFESYWDPIVIQMVSS